MMNYLNCELNSKKQNLLYFINLKKHFPLDRLLNQKLHSIFKFMLKQYQYLEIYKLLLRRRTLYKFLKKKAK